MSLFGQQSSSQPATNSPFAGLNLTPTVDAQGKRPSIFDASTSQRPSQPPTAPGLSATTAAPTASLFSLGAPAKPSPPTFSFTPATSTTTAAPSTSIFGTTSTTAQPPSTTPAFSFGPPATSQPPAAQSTFGNSLSGSTLLGSVQQPTSTIPQTRDAAAFSSLLERQKKKPRLGAENNGRQAALPNFSMDLGDLARRAQEIRHRGSRQAELATDSRAHYLLAGSGVAPGQAYKDFQALGPEDSAAISRPTLQSLAEESSTYLGDLRTKGRDAMLRESIDRVYREVDNFIEESLGIDLEEQKVRIMEHFGLMSPEDRDDNGPQNGSGAADGAFGKSAPSRSTRSVFGRSAIEKSIIGAAGSGASTASFFKGEGAAYIPSGLPRGQSLRDLRDKEKAFIGKVEELNMARLQDLPYQLLRQFGEAEEQNPGDSPRQLVDAYHALAEIVKEGQSTIAERQYAAAYLEESPTAASASRLRKQIVEGSRTYLEKSFWREMKMLIEKNAREASLGGQPSVINIVRAYIRLRAARRDLSPDGAELQQLGGENGDYCWVLIFYLLRCGFVKEAFEYVDKDPAFQSVERRFVNYMRAYAKNSDRKLERKMQDMIDNEYQNRTKAGPKNSVDPYRIACYKVIGRCDLSSRNLDAVGQGVEDWLWLQFSLARETERLEELSGEVFGLEQICETITEIGQQHFQKGQPETTNTYGTFFLMQILSGMFEPAVEYLHNFNPVSAVHFAIALSYYGLLRVSDYTVAGNELLTYSTSQQPLLNFVPLVAYYTATFRTALPVAAVEYLSMICLNSDLKPAKLGAIHTNACHECLRELCLETREFARLLGDIQRDGSRIPGAIEIRAKLIHLDTREEFLKSITGQSAAVADQRGQVSDAVLLYHLCEDYDNVVSVLNRALADAVTIDLGEAPMQLQPLKPRQSDGQSESATATPKSSPQSSLSLTQSTSSPVELARDMISLYNENAAYYNRISSSNREICGALLRLLSVRAHLESNPPRFMTALEELNELNLLPLQANGSIPIIRAAATAFGALPQLLARCAGVSVVWAVRAIGGERDNLMVQGRWEAGVGGDADGMRDQLSAMAKDLMVFAGLVKYKLPGRVYDMLTRAGGDVGGF